MSVQIRVTNTEALASAKALRKGLFAMAPLFRELGRVLESNYQVRFDTKRDPDGAKWPGWAPSTKKQRQKAGYVQGRSLLQLHNPGMRDSLTVRHGPDFVEMNMSSPYAKYHEQLTPGRGKLPRRAMLFGAGGQLGKKDVEAINRATTRYFQLLLNHVR